MKKLLLFVVLTMCLCLVFCACGTPEEPAAEEAAPEETAEPATESVAEEKPVLEIAQSGWTVENGYLFYFVDLRNNDPEKAITGPSFYVNARNEAGEIIGTSEETLFVIYPGEDHFFGFQAFEAAEEPAEVEFVPVEPSKDDFSVVTGEYIPLRVVSANRSGENIVGEIANDNDADVEMAAVVVVYKDAAGQYTAADTTFTDVIPANGTAPFSLWCYNDFAQGDFDVYVYQW